MLKIDKVTFEKPPSIESIGECAFAGCASLIQITIPSSVRSIGDYAFSGCILLTKLIIPSSVTSLGVELFSRSITIPSNLEIKQNDVIIEEDNIFDDVLDYF